MIQWIFETKEGLKLNCETNFELNSFDKKKPLLIFNYGLVCNKAHWEKQLPFFDQQGFQILHHDYRFHFGSEGTDNIEDCTFDNIVLDVRQIIEHIGAKKIFMLGHSMGVNICLEYARQYPKNLLGMILISGTVFPPQDVMFDSNWVEVCRPIYEWAGKFLAEKGQFIWKSAHKNPLLIKLVADGGFNTSIVPDEFVAHYVKKIGELPPELFFQMFSQMREHKIIKHLPEITTKTLIMGGNKDKVIPFYVQRIIEDLMPNTEMYIIDEGSHVPQVDFANTANERMIFFINSLI